jgi:GntR family transcriptional regulator / MocR family aminotransferase
VKSRRKPDWAALLDPVIERDASIPIFRQLYLQLRKSILDRVLPPGSRMPSTRGLARQLGLSRSSVMIAYELLTAEGYLTARVGSGSYVPELLPVPVGAKDGPVHRLHGPRPLSRTGQRYRQFIWEHTSFANTPFNTGRCAIDDRTMAIWRKLSNRHFSKHASLHAGYSDPRGASQLRRAVCDYLRVARAVRCEPEQVLIVSGAQHAVDLALRVLLDPGDAVWLEDPCYPAVHAALSAHGARIVPVPVDGDGLIVAAGVAAAPDAKLAYVTPSHQFPSGALMAMGRRVELLDWAWRTGGWVIEDDYDSEFRYTGRPLAALQGIDKDERVIYVGTLNKVLFPGLRIGYAVVPNDLVDAFTAARFLGDRNPPSLTQLVLADVIEQGFFTSHIRRMRQRYHDARNVLSEHLRLRLAGCLEVEAPVQGMQLVARFSQPWDDVDAAMRARERALITRPLTPMFIAAPPAPGLLLGFTGYTPEQLMRAVDVLAGALEEKSGTFQLSPRRGA